MIEESSKVTPYRQVQHALRGACFTHFLLTGTTGITLPAGLSIDRIQTYRHTWAVRCSSCASHFCILYSGRHARPRGAMQVPADELTSQRQGLRFQLRQQHTSTQHTAAACRELYSFDFPSLLPRDAMNFFILSKSSFPMAL